MKISFRVNRAISKNNKISYIGREFASTPATGYAKKHLAQQREIIEEVFK